MVVRPPTENVWEIFRGKEKNGGRKERREGRRKKRRERKGGKRKEREEERNRKMGKVKFNLNMQAYFVNLGT